MSNLKKTVLIIKLGYCETLVNETGFMPSLGDVFRHTVLLHHYKDCRVTWLASESVYPLLEGNPMICELLIYGTAAAEQLRRRSFDEVLCFEKAPALCELAKSIKADRHYGFGWNGSVTHAHPMAQEALDIANGKKRHLVLQDILYQMIGAQWKGEGYVLGYTPTTTPTIDVGLNYLVGSKWPSKAWPMHNWKKLETICRDRGFSVSWQRGISSLYEYMDWVNSVRLLVTCDSLGMHLGIAMQKQVVALFGPTASHEIHLYGRGVIVQSKLKCPNAPCMLTHCNQPLYCMDHILPEAVFEEIARLQQPPQIMESSPGFYEPRDVVCAATGVA